MFLILQTLLIHLKNICTKPEIKKYSMFDILFETPAYRNLYVISDSEMKELQRTQNQDELQEIRHQ